MSLLVINAGSSSLKLALFDDDAAGLLVHSLLDWSDPLRPARLVTTSRDGLESHSLCDVSDHRGAAMLALRALFEPGSPAAGRRDEVAVVGHRVVHGGARFAEGVRVDDAVKAEIGRLAELAPLHNPAALEVIDAAEAMLPGVPQVAAFDTAFFARLPDASAVYPLPYEWHADWGIRRFGFHGLSHSYCFTRAAEMLGRDPAGLRVVSCHLGNGCSATATLGGRALDTTMGYTPLEGLMMGTRSGSVDPSILLDAIRRRGLTVDELDDALNHRSGLRGVSGVGSDYRQVEQAADAGDGRARLALEIYAHRVRAAIGALAATLGGLDAVVFTAGVGEHSARLRAAACAGLEFLGVRLDPDRNATAAPDADLAADGSPARFLAIRTREDLVIAREARRLVLDGRPAGGS